MPSIYGQKINSKDAIIVSTRVLTHLRPGERRTVVLTLTPRSVLTQLMMSVMPNFFYRDPGSK